MHRYLRPTQCYSLLIAVLRGNVGFFPSTIENGRLHYSNQHLLFCSFHRMHLCRCLFRLVLSLHELYANEPSLLNHQMLNWNFTDVIKIECVISYIRLWIVICSAFKWTLIMAYSFYSMVFPLQPYCEIHCA